MTAWHGISHAETFPVLQSEMSFPAVTDAKQHISNVGVMVEEAENKMRSALNDIYFGKTKVRCLVNVSLHMTAHRLGATVSAVYLPRESVLMIWRSRIARGVVACPLPQQDIVNDLRSIDKLSEKAKQRAFQEEIAKKLSQRQSNW